MLNDQARYAESAALHRCFLRVRFLTMLGQIHFVATIETIVPWLCASGADQNRTRKPAGFARHHYRVAVNAQAACAVWRALNKEKISD